MSQSLQLYNIWALVSKSADFLWHYRQHHPPPGTFLLAAAWMALKQVFFMPRDPRGRVTCP